MTKLVNRAKMTTATTGTGTLTLGSAVDGYQTFAAAGVADADVVRYVIEDGDAWEIGLGTYTASGTTLTRGSIESSNSDLALNLTGNAVVYVSAAAADLQELVDFADNFVLPTSDGSTGQVLTTNGAGTLSFTTISGYTDADVDTHLNTGTASSGEVLSWTGTDYDWVSGGATNIDGLSDAAKSSTGMSLGKNNTVDASVHVGVEAGGYTAVAPNSVFVGYQSNFFGNSSADGTVAVGYRAARNVRAPRTVAIGDAAMGSTSGSIFVTGSDNIGIGYQTGLDLTTGNNNFLGGYQAGANLTTGVGNIHLGYQAGVDMTTGNYNVLAGFQAGGDLTTGSNNIALGRSSLRQATTAQNNIAIGQDVMEFSTFDGIQNIGVGFNSLNRITTGDDNVSIGAYSGFYLTSGSTNVYIGSFAGERANGNHVISIGSNSGRWLDGTNSVAVGRQALYGDGTNRLTGSDNVGIGFQTGYDLSTGNNNFLGGFRAGYDLTTGSNNVAIGNGALDAATTGGRNIAIGQDAMGLGVATAASGYNIAVGYLAGFDITSAVDNVLVGQSAGENVTTGSDNIGIGRRAIRNVTTGTLNVAIGANALSAGTATATSSGTAIGFNTLANATGDFNTALGRNAGLNLGSGANNTIIGYNAEASSATVSNEITLGNSSITRFRVPGAGIDNTSAALSGTTPSVDVGARDTYTLTTSGNTTFTFTGVFTSGQVGTFSLIITAGGTHTLTWPASVDWAGGSAPDAPASGEVDVYTFMTINGGTTWYGFLAGDAMA